MPTCLSIILVLLIIKTTLQGRGDGWVWKRPGPKNASKKCDGRPRLDCLREDHHLSQAQVAQAQAEEAQVAQLQSVSLRTLYEKITTSQEIKPHHQ